ncbi:hypothetical protein D3C85_1210320 [compost metagenome]
MEEFNLSAEDLENLPLFYRRIYYNKLTSKEEEEKLFRYNADLQCEMMRSDFPIREISKTVNHKIFRLKKDE